MSIKIVVGVIAVVTCIMIAVFQNKKIWFTTGAALLVILLGTIVPNSIFYLQPLKEMLLQDPMLWFIHLLK